MTTADTSYGPFREFDPLTGFLNRTRFFDAVQGAFCALRNKALGGKFGIKTGLMTRQRGKGPNRGDGEAQSTRQTIWRELLRRRQRTVLSASFGD
jgi:hypothetical protein